MIQNRKEEDPVDFENNYGKVLLVLFWFHVRHFLQLNHFETKQNKNPSTKMDDFTGYFRIAWASWRANAHVIPPYFT